MIHLQNIDHAYGMPLIYETLFVNHNGKLIKTRHTVRATQLQWFLHKHQDAHFIGRGKAPKRRGRHYTA